MSFGLYATEFLIFIGGLAYGAHLLHAPQHWIVAGAIVPIGTWNCDRRHGDASERSSWITPRRRPPIRCAR